VVLLSFQSFPLALFEVLWVFGVAAYTSAVLSCQTLAYVRLTAPAPEPSETIEVCEPASNRPETEVPDWPACTRKGSNTTGARDCRWPRI
jgi:hypothetical protein